MLLDEHGFASSHNVSFNGGSHGIEQRLVPHGLREEIDSPGLHCLYAHWNVAMSGEKDDRRRILPGCEMTLQIEAA
jgi:hypothetical protein